MIEGIKVMKDNTDQKNDNEDIFLWADGTNCYRYEIGEMNHMSDDYCVLYFGSDDYLNFIKELE